MCTLIKKFSGGIWTALILPFKFLLRKSRPMETKTFRSKHKLCVSMTGTMKVTSASFVGTAQQMDDGGR